MAYAKIKDTFWTDDKIAKLGLKEKLAYLYLMTCPHKNLIGLYRIPVAYMAFDLNWEPGEVEEAIRALENGGFIKYDFQTAFVLIKRFLKHNRLENPNQITAAVTKIEELAVNPLIADFAKALEDIDDTALEPLRNRLSTVAYTEAVAVTETVKETEAVTVGEMGICAPLKSSSPDGDQLLETPSVPHRAIPYKAIKDLYNSLCPGLRPLKTLTDERKKAISARWHMDPEFQTLKFWESFWNRVWCSDWLCGRVEGRDGKSFTADFDWCLRPRSFSRIVEGKYDPQMSRRGNGTKNRMDILAERDPQDILRETFAPRNLRDDGIETVESEGADHDQR
jgi:hypothetical protein